VDIYPNVNDADASWQTLNRWFAYIDSPPPLRDAAYHLEITDAFGKSATYTTPVINAIAAKAIPTIEEKVNDSWQSAGELPQGEALYELRFKHDQSANANHYEWIGFANARQANGDRTVVWTESTTNANAEVKPQMPHNGRIYEGYTPGSYQVRLIVRNNVCVDSVSIRHIVVEPSLFDKNAIPNAFTPNGDGLNDIFTFVRGEEPRSMEYINVYIYNRSGGMVYEYEGRIDAWAGWDGRMMGTGRNVAEGVYFYIISGRGWDNVDYNTKEYSGYLHLFR
jgi:gliding motility-associated-like protein